MHYLRSGHCNIVAKLPVQTTVGTVVGGSNGGAAGGPRSEIKLTPAGLAALQAPI
jgi:hypothetical protein